MRDVRLPDARVGRGAPVSAAIKLVVFDLAGTTIKDSGHVAAAFVTALGEHDIRVSDDQLASVRGGSKREAIARLIPEGPEHTRQANAIYESFRRHLRAAFDTHGVDAVEGAAALFRQLRNQSIRVALNTGFDRDVTQLIVQALRWDAQTVDAVICGDEVRQGRPAPYLIFHAMEATGVTAVDEVANVGDTALDLHAGHNAGVRWNIGVLTGAHDRATLTRAPHTHLLESVRELPSLLTES
jgi:phosphonatase-like hydrolase